jgi:molecular chaperone HscB
VDEEQMSKNAFELFKMPCCFKINYGDLEKRYRELSKEVHPDFHKDKPREVQTNILDLCSKVNCAYRELRSPKERARLLLKQLAGQEFSPDRKKLPPGFLMEILEFQEELEELSSPVEDKFDRLEEMEESLEKRLNVIYEELNRDFEGLMSRPGDPVLAEEIQLKLNMISYHERLLTQIERMMDAA